MGAQVTAVGYLVCLNHYSSQDIPAIGKQRQHNAAQALLQVSAREHTPPHIGSFLGRFEESVIMTGGRRDDHSSR